MKERNSSVEIFRILAMFLVCVVHWNGWFVPMPDSFSSDYSAASIGQILIESISAPCVNMFLIISGYYGVKLKARSLVNLFLLILSVSLPFYIVNSVWHQTFDVNSFLRCFLVFTHYGCFVQCYVMLLFLSPVINVAIERYGKRLLPWVLLFWLIEFMMGFVWVDADRLGVNYGYSLIHFVLMYFMARMLYLFRIEVLQMNKLLWLCGYVPCVIVISIMYVWFGKSRAYSYANPFVIISAFCLFIPFLHHTFYSKGVNWIAKRTFTVYVIQVTSPVIGVLCLLDKQLFLGYPYVSYVFISLFVLLFLYGGAILYDYIRCFITDPIMHYICEKKLIRVFDNLFCLWF